MNLYITVLIAFPSMRPKIHFDVANWGGYLLTIYDLYGFKQPWPFW